MPYKSSSVDLEEDFMFWLKKKRKKILKADLFRPFKLYDP